MLGVINKQIMLSVIMLSVIMRNVVMLSVMDPPPPQKGLLFTTDFKLIGRRGPWF